MTKGQTDFQAVERTAPCSSCSAPVKIRRPSLTGAHFCIRKECQAEKQRFYQRRRSAEAARLEENERGLQVDFILGVLWRATNVDRVECANCGRADAVPNLIHPTPDLEGACRALVQDDPPPGLGSRVVFTIWPEAKAAHERREAARLGLARQPEQA